MYILFLNQIKTWLTFSQIVPTSRTFIFKAMKSFIKKWLTGSLMGRGASDRVQPQSDRTEIKRGTYLGPNALRWDHILRSAYSPALIRLGSSMVRTVISHD